MEAAVLIQAMVVVAMVEETESERHPALLPGGDIGLHCHKLGWS